MVDTPNVDEHISSRRSIRSCRLSTIKTKPTIEVKKEEEEEEPLVNDNDIDQADPPELFQLGDMLWVRVSGNPWWPALIYGSYYEDYIHTKIIRSGRRAKSRRYFVYFFGPAFEYAWAYSNSLIPYSGLDEFIRLAETSVQNATTKSEQEMLASRYELKVAANKRPNWDKAIEEADRAFKLTREERIANFDEILKDILNKAERNSTKKRNSSTTARLSRKTSSPASDKSSNRSSIKRQKTKSTPMETPTNSLRFGLPTLTKKEKKHITNGLLHHPNPEQLTLHEGQSIVCKLATEMVKENFQYEMTCVQIEWFYDFLLEHSEIISKYSHWFKEETKPILDDAIYSKQCQLQKLIRNERK